MSGQIFISYRRDDASHPAGRLYEHLVARFPKSRVFFDIDNLDPGDDFREAIEKSVGACDVFVAVIGRNWLSSSNEEGNRRLDNPDDFVRLEISTALKRGIRVVPVLVDGALMPRATQLPEELQPLIRRQAIELSHTRFGADAERLIDVINRTIEKAVTRQREENERLEIERAEKQRLEAGRLEKERLEAEQLKKQRLEAEHREKQRLETERLKAEQCEKERLEAELREKERLEAERLEKERLEAERREKERLGAEQREKERVAAEQREASPIKRNFPTPLPTSFPIGEHTTPAQVSTPPIVQSQGSINQRSLKRLAPIAVFGLILIGGLIWFVASPFERRERQEILATPTPAAIATPTGPGSTATPETTPTPTPTPDATFYNYRGFDSYQKKDYDNAISDFNEAITLDPKYVDAYNNRGNAHYGKQEYDKAISDYNEAIRLDPKSALAYHNRGLAHYGKQEYDKAISDFNEGITLDPKYVDAYINRGAVYNAKKDYDNAISDFNEAITLDPKYVDAYIGIAYYNRGWAYKQLGKNAEAQADFDKAKQLGYTGPESTPTPPPTPTPTPAPTRTPAKPYSKGY